MQNRLKAIGLRPINALVDITNYITFDHGRPLHVFDAKKVAGNLVIRRAREGDEILALDGKTYAPRGDMCVIADENGVESIAGVMGGEHSGCDENTTDVLIESALWAPLNIARTGRALGIITDARYRFERGVDPEFMVPGLDLATKMVIDLCGGEASEASVTGYAKAAAKVVSFPVSEVKRLTGEDVDAAESLNILTRLGFGVSGSGAVVNVSVPSLAARCRWQGGPCRGSHAHAWRQQHHAAAARKAHRHQWPHSDGAANPHPPRQAHARVARHDGGAELVVHRRETRAGLRRRHGGAQARQPHRRRHVRHAPLAAAGPHARRAAQRRPGIWRRRFV